MWRWRCRGSNASKPAKSADQLQETKMNLAGQWIPIPRFARRNEIHLLKWTFAEARAIGIVSGRALRRGTATDALGWRGQKRFLQKSVLPKIDGRGKVVSTRCGFRAAAIFPFSNASPSTPAGRTPLPHSSFVNNNLRASRDHCQNCN
jgi:hypothetical protein